jgi:voltage-gated potassium channel
MDHAGLSAHCPRAEAMVSMAMEMMVRSAQDPGSSRIQQDLLSVVKGQTQFSMKVPANARPFRYGALLSQLKERHNATLIAVAEDVSGKGLELNAPIDHPVAPGAVIYYIAATRIPPEQVDWAGPRAVVS